MTRKPAYTIHHHDHHTGWDNAIPPRLRVAPGTVLDFEVIDASGGQITSESDVTAVTRIDPGRVNPVTGPVFIDGAEPGDALKVTLLDYAPSGWGWTANIPGFGLLADQFPDPALALWSYDARGLTPALYGPGGRVPLKPFAGTIGLAPAAPGRHDVIPPRRVGGNMDIRDMAAGTELLLPVEVPGALFSIGDTHAAQGDGEVCGTAIESPMTVTLQLDVVKGAAPRHPRFCTPGPVSRPKDERGFWVTTGIGPDLFEGARAAVSEMIEHLGTTQGLSAVDAYLLCSVCADLRISEIVDQPNWVVSFYFPRIVFE
ncbi:MAG: acetamidase [Alphaproteobacteria bacterium]|jgi:acetamidase/formamidase|nr:acetamidase [Alphaproteobacteria bacterium]